MAAKNVVNVGVYETPGMLARIKAAAQIDGLSVARWCRHAIRRKLKESENAQSQATG